MFKFSLRLSRMIFSLLLMFMILGCDTEEDPLKPLGEDTVAATDIVKGDLLDTSTLTGSFVDPKTHETIVGELIWDNPDKTLSEDTAATWTFIPNDERYETITGTVTIGVMIEVIEPRIDEAVEAVNIDAGEALGETVLSGSFVDPDTGDIIDGTLAWTNPDQIIDEDTEVEWRFIPNDDRYEIITGTIMVETEATPDGFLETQSVFYNEIQYRTYKTNYNRDAAMSAFQTTLLEDGYTVFEPEPGLESHFIEETGASIGGQFYADDTHYLYLYKVPGIDTVLVTAKVEQHIVEDWLTPEDLSPDEDLVDAEDFDLLPRYEGSQLTYSKPKETGLYKWFRQFSETFSWAGDTLHYRIRDDKATLDDIYDFYKGILAPVNTNGEENWVITEDKHDEKRFVLVAEISGLTVAVVGIDYDGDDVIRYELYTNTWTNEGGPIPETDDFSPLPALDLYPDAVGIYENTGTHSVPYFAGNYGDWTETQYVERVYVVEADAHDVFNYYRENVSYYNGKWVDEAFWLDITSRTHFVWPNTRTLEFFTPDAFITIVIADASHYEDAVTISFYMIDLVPLPEADRYAVEDFSNVPRYPNAVALQDGRTDQPFLSHDRLVYGTLDDFDDVKDYYLTTLEDDGWFIHESSVYEITHFGTPKMFAFVAEHDLHYSVITIERGRGYQDATHIEIFRIDKLKPLPDEDLVGQDFDHVERYEGAIIFEEAFEDLASYNLLVYAVPIETLNDMIDVYNFYKNYFDEDWEIIYKNFWIEGGYQQFIVHVRKGAHNVKLEGDERSPYQDTFTIIIHDYYESEGALPEADIMGEDFEAIDRYPDSVLLLAEDNIRHYGSYDSLDDVKQFYMTYLPNAGFTIVDTESEDDSVSITAMIGFDTFIHIMITEDSDYDDAVEITIAYTED